MSEQKRQSSLRGMGNSSFRETLRDLKQHGCNVLLCGALPRDDIEYLSTRLLGESSGVSDVTRLFGLLDQDIASVHSRLALIDGSLDSAHVIATDSEMRSASAADSSTLTDGHRLNVTTVPRDIERFEIALHRTIEEFGCEHDENGHTTLRVCVDSLQPLFAGYETERIEGFLFDLDEAAGANQCMIHSILPVAHDAPIVKRITPHFDIVMSLRVAEGSAVQEQWRLVASDYWTDWIPIRHDPIENLTHQ